MMHSRYFKMIRYFLVMSLAFSLAACAPGLNNSLRVRDIPIAEVSQNPTTYGASLKIRVERLTDTRADSAIATVDGRSIQPEGDVSDPVQQALERMLRSRGMQITLFDSPPTISGELIQWSVNIRPKFPVSVLEAVAVVHILLSNSQSQVVYSARYEGRASMQHPYPRESTIKETLGSAMSEALGQIVRDQRLYDKILEISSSN